MRPSGITDGIPEEPAGDAGEGGEREASMRPSGITDGIASLEQRLVRVLQLDASMRPSGITDGIEIDAKGSLLIDGDASLQ